MSEENKTVELKDEELEKVSGGAGVVYTSVSKGDRFTSPYRTCDYLVVRRDYDNLTDNTYISVDFYGSSGFLVSSETTRVILSKHYYYDFVNSNPNYVPM